MSAIVVYCSCPDLASAERIGHALVEQRLAACVSILPGVRSIYRWQGAIERADEVQLTIKTQASRFPALRDAVLALHPYELPELIAVEAVAALDRYLDWIGESTTSGADS